LKRQHGWDRTRIRGLAGARASGAAGACSPTTRSRSPPSPADTATRQPDDSTARLTRAPAHHGQPASRPFPGPSHQPDSYFFRTK
jgi:hypothetical protein